MKSRILAVLVGSAALALWLARQGGQQAAARPSPASVAPAEPALAASSLAAPRSVFKRDPFRFADEQQPAPALNADPELRQGPTPAPALKAPEPRVRLVGFVRHSGRVKVALAIDGQLVVAAAGEQAERYQVLAIDEEGGVRLRAPDGQELVLRPPDEGRD